MTGLHLLTVNRCALWTIVLLLTMPAKGLGQLRISTTPERFGLIENVQQSLNPAFTGIKGSQWLQSNYIGHSGLRRNIRTFAVQAGFQLGSDSTTDRKSFGGLHLYRDNEGNFISRTSLHLDYALTIPVTYDWKMIAGGAIGVHNLQFAATQFRAGASDFTINSNIGFILSNDVWLFGISGNQLFNSNLSPLSEVHELSRHIFASASRSLELSSTFSLFPMVWAIYGQGFHNLGTNITGLFWERLLIGMNVEFIETISWNVGIRTNYGAEGGMDLLMGYHLPIGTETVENSLKYEIGVAFFRKKNENVGY